MATIARAQKARDPAAGRDRRLRAAGLGVLAALLVGTTASAGYALWTELLASRAEALAADAVAPDGSAAADLTPLAQVERQCLSACAPRVLDAAATVRLAAAAALPPDRRGPLLAQAGKDLAAARAAEPRNGAPAIRTAYAAALAPGAAPGAVLDLIERSYAVQPYSRSGGFWRLEGVVRNWPIASPNLKNAALREALWLPVTGAYDRAAITDLFEKADLGLQLQLARSLPPR